MTSSLPARAAISHILLDIEGTTCPFDFVKDTLFPYATDQLESFLAAEARNPQVGQLLRAIEHAWKHEDNQEALELLASARLNRGLHRCKTIESVEQLAYVLGD